MGNSKLGKFILLGALRGGVAALLDRSTRTTVVGTSKKAANEITFYAKNPESLKQKLVDQKDKFQAAYEQLSGDVSYIKEQVEELKALTPQVKEFVTDTKETFVDSKEEYETIMKDPQTATS
ncbi:YtxH domain-containing protein [Sporosarcina sp. BI001-red]|uniref:YtxH domain-containing protein n=1 Tax=Sporosarcina sp. BI001-red TaxID=2282866 RepID=UPI000E27C15F|nr:YtxH domain-containing protein [Sporosarcina sp. BI001-red]REB05306.1 YtxH domain-containing protein [Sporosarcina sp. BI001-red]